MEYTYNPDLVRKAFQQELAIIIIGQSGCGKETQSKLLKEIHREVLGNLPLCIETGLLFRQNIPRMSPFSRQRLLEIQKQGLLQSPAIATALWVLEFVSNYQQGVVLIDGSPRSELEAKNLIDFCWSFAQKKLAVFHIKITDEEAKRRMILRNEELIRENKSPREETLTPEARENKCAYYHERIIPALKIFSSNPAVCDVWDVDGMQPREKVSQEIISILEKSYSCPIRIEALQPQASIIDLDSGKSLKEYEKEIIQLYLNKYSNDVLLVAEKLNIGKSTIYRMLQAGEVQKQIS